MKKVIKKQNGSTSGFVNYPVGDLVIRIKNAALAGHKSLDVPFNKLAYGVVSVLKDEGFLSEVKKDGEVIKIGIAYRSKQPVLVDLKIVSKPGKRVYMGASDILKKKGPSTYVVTTSKGVMSAKNVIKNNVGGEVIVEAS